MRAPARPTDTTTNFTPADAAAAVGPTQVTSSTSSHSVDGSPAPSSFSHLKLSAGLIAAALAAVALTPAAAQAQVAGFRQVIEYTCPITSPDTVPPADPNPGALIYENGFVYFVTRVAMPGIAELRLVRLTPGTNPVCNWWDLDGATVTTGGLRFKTSANQAFIRGVTDLQRINTVTNVRTRWVDGLTSLSDVAIHTNTKTNVYTTGVAGCPTPTVPGSCALLAGNAVLQRFSVTNGNNSGSRTQWLVGGGAGLVPYSGVDVHPAYPNRIYFSQPFDDMIGELDTSNNMIRRWNLAELGLGVTGPRQLDVDANGIVWVGTASGQLVRLDPTTPTGNVHVAEVPLSFLSSVVAIDADAFVGYTTSDDLSKVGMFRPTLGAALDLAPAGPVMVAPSPENANLNSVASPVVTQSTGIALRVPKTVESLETPDVFLNGNFIEAVMPTAVPNGACTVPNPLVYENPCPASVSPQGIAAADTAGAYFAAMGSSLFRVAYVSLIEASGPGGGAVAGSGKMALTDPLTGQPAGTGYFTLWAAKNSQSSPTSGLLNYTAPDGKIQSLQVTGLTFSGNTATVTGLCKSGSNCTTFQVKSTDGGWQASQDIFKITKDPILGLGLEKGGNLGSGGIKMYRWQ